jgi:hypothetical protein
MAAMARIFLADVFGTLSGPLHPLDAAAGAPIRLDQLGFIHADDGHWRAFRCSWTACQQYQAATVR